MKFAPEKTDRASCPRAGKRPFLQTFTTAAVFLIVCLFGIKACMDGHPGVLAVLAGMLLLVVFLIVCRKSSGSGFLRSIGTAALILLTVFTIAASVVNLIGILAKVLR